MVTHTLYSEDVMKFFTIGGNPHFMDNSDATKMHHAYTRFIAHLTTKSASADMQSMA